MAARRRRDAIDAPESAPSYRSVRRRRTVVDVRRLLGYLALLLLGIALTTVADRTMAGIDADLVEALGVIPTTVAVVVLGVVQVLYVLLLLGTPIVLVVTRRFGALGRGALAIVLAPIAFTAIEQALGLRASTEAVATAGDLAGAGWPPTGALATYAAVAAVLGPTITRRWRRAIGALLLALALSRILTATSAPLDVVLAVAVGGVVGSALLLALGRSDRVLTLEGVVDVLAGAGLPVDTVGPVEAGREGWDYRARSADGPIEIKVVDEHDWHRSRLARAYRRARLRDVGDDTPYSSPERAVGAEVMLGLFARSRGVRVPLVRAVARAPGGEVLLAVEAVAGTPLDRLPDKGLSDDVLRGCWEQVARLREARIAHRNLRLGNLLLDDMGHVWVLGLDLGESAAVDGVLAGDVAELLAATGVRVGPARAVAVAHDELGTGPLVDAVARLVPPALSAPTRAAVKASPDGLRSLVDEVCRVTGITEPQFVDVERVKPRVLLMGAMIAVAVYFLAPQLTDLPGMLTAVREADLSWLPAVLLASVATYAGAALGLAGGTPGRIPVGEAGAVALASSFVATFAPPGVGQVGLNIRYLQKRGFATPIAVSASAAKEAAVLAVHVVLLAIFAVWAGRTGALADELERLPPAGVVAAVAGAVLALVGIALALPRVRRTIREAVVPAVRSSVDAMRTVISNPAKLVTLFAGVVLLPLGYAACLFFAVEAFGGGASFAAVGLVSLTAGSIATAAPTPGGIGAVEAVLLAALTGIGIASAPALAAVFLYRVATFWLPIAPGAVAFRSLTRRDVL